MAKKNTTTWFPTWSGTQTNLNDIDESGLERSAGNTSQRSASVSSHRKTNSLQDDKSHAQQAKEPNSCVYGGIFTKNSAFSDRRMSLNDDTQRAKLKPRASTLSLNSFKGNWLAWSSKDTLLQGENDGAGLGTENGSESADITPDSKPRQVPSLMSQTSSKKDEEEDVIEGTDDENGASEAQKRKSSWTFWNASEEGAKKTTPDLGRVTNKILRSTPSIPSKEDLQPKTKHSKSESFDSDNTAEEEAVLYKPHTSASEFNKINTHKNENLEENGLVPLWESCLREQSSASASATSSNILPNGGIKNGQAFDIKYWRSYLSHISTRLGFSSSSNDEVSDSDSSEPQDMEKELNMLYERSYKLYGRSLCKLPPQKRACLPNFSSYYTVSQERPLKRQKTQLEEDSENANSISVTNDAMGNLLINYSDQKADQKGQIGPKSDQKSDQKGHSGDHKTFKSDIVNQKPGPLRKIKKVLIIGVHGFFPTKMIRPIIGAPKGTSLKFANEAEKAMLRYFVENDMINEHDSNHLSIQKIALEKEGKIFDRVDFFLKILNTWKKELNEADFVFTACHSQGCVVSIILLAQLIEKGILEKPTFKRLGILGMAGINNGPFFGIDKSFFMKAYSAIEHDSMMELFELTKFNSKQSVAYKEAMQVIIGANVKICFVGSINDQLVPLYSALASHIFHPNIYRACYIDQTSRTPDFVKQLVSMSCQLQNMGYFDNNVIKEISPILAGPLTGGGHSKIYNDGKVYDLGIKFFLDTDDMVIPENPQPITTQSSKPADSRVPITNQIYVKEYNVGKIGTNPFILPWCLRGLIFNVEKNWKRENSGHEQRSGLDEIRSLYESFDSWRPDTKALKELKFRLNGIRASKL